MSEAKWRTLLEDVRMRARYGDQDRTDRCLNALAAEVERIEHERDGLRRVMDGPNPGEASPLASDLVWITRDELAKYEAAEAALASIWERIERRCEKQAIAAELGVGEWEAFLEPWESELRALVRR